MHARGCGGVCHGCASHLASICIHRPRAPAPSNPPSPHTTSTGASAPLPSRQATPALLARVVPPSDPALRQAIDSLAFYVARSGGASEDLVRSTQVQNGAGHSFLLGGPGSAYYAWKVGGRL